MKRIFSILIAIATTAIIVAGILPTKFYVWVGGNYTAYDIDAQDMTYSDGTLTIKGTTYRTADIDSITFTEPVIEDDTTEYVVSDTVYVTYAGTSAIVTPAVEGVTTSISGADVTITNANTDREMCFVLSGNSSSGSFIYNGTLKTTIRLAGLTLTGSTAEAINIKCGKRIALELADGTTNTLADASTDGGQKGAFYTKGHLEISGGGTLNLTGNQKHAISSKEYMLVKRTAGTINITSAANDGIHAGQYFKMNGGTVKATNVKGDGIQAEATGEEGEEDDGQMFINGGTINLTLTGQDAAALKSDSLMTISGGDITLQSSGAAVKGIKSKTDLLITDGSLVIKQSGDYVIEDGEPSYTTAIKASGDLTISGGTINITNTAIAGRGLSADGTLTINEDKTSTTITITNSGKGETLDTSKTIDSDSEGETPTESYRVYVNVPTSSGGGGPGGSNRAWSTVYLYDASSDTQVAQLTNTVTVTVGSTSKTFYYYDFKKSDSGTYYFQSTYTSGGGWGGGTTYTLKSTTFPGPTSGSAYFYTMSSNYTTSGSTRTYTLTDATSTYSKGTISTGGSTSSGNYVTPKGISGDGNIVLEAGTITITMSGQGGKGINADQTFTMGCSDKTGPILNVTTTGAAMNNSGGGGGFPGGGGSTGGNGSPKGIKVQGKATLLGGELTINTSQNRAEGLESKTSVDIQGGHHYIKAYDDCINSAGSILFNGGITVCYSNGNDAVDSNYGRSGAVVIGNGVVFAYTSKGSPEEGFDCDNNSYIQITGTGIGISAGGSQGGGSSSSTISGAKQGYAFITSSVGYQSGRYYTLADASGNNLVTYSFPASVTSTLSLITATGMKSGSSYNVKYSTTAPTDATTEFHGLYLGSSHVGTSSAINSFSAK